VTEPVELRADLPELAANKLVVTDELVLAKRFIRGRTGDVKRVGPLTKQRHPLLVGLPQVVDDTGGDELHRSQDLFRCDPVGRAGLVFWPPNGVRPPRAGLAGLGCQQGGGDQYNRDKNNKDRGVT
jgi:hypothetical protein